jgi:hypothetical protein
MGGADPFIVLPTPMFGRGKTGYTPTMGDYCVVIVGNVLYPAIIGDAGPIAKTGEASLRLCKQHQQQGQSRLPPSQRTQGHLPGFPRLVGSSMGSTQSREVARALRGIAEGFRRLHRGALCVGGHHQVIRSATTASSATASRSGCASVHYPADTRHPANTRNTHARPGVAHSCRYRSPRESGKVPIIPALSPNFPLVSWMMLRYAPATTRQATCLLTSNHNTQS